MSSCFVDDYPITSILTSCLVPTVICLAYRSKLRLLSHALVHKTALLSNLNGSCLALSEKLCKYCKCTDRNYNEFESSRCIIDICYSDHFFIARSSTVKRHHVTPKPVDFAVHQFGKTYLKI